MRILVFTVLASLLGAACAASSPNPWFALNGSWGTYAMSDVNDDIATVNDNLAGTGLKMDEIHAGGGIGGRFGLDVADRWSVGIAYDRLFASSDVGDASGKLEYKFPANAFQGFAEFVPRSGLHMGIGLGLVSAAGSVEVTDYSSPPPLKVDVSGSGPLIEGSLGGEYWMIPKLALTGSAGVRYAKIGEIKAEGTVVENPDGSKYTIDYSGVLLRVGMKLAFLR
jgi:hypothetical protein